MNLFQTGEFVSASGRVLDWKIECDALTDDDWNTLGWLLADGLEFGKVLGVPTGGEPLARAMRSFEEPERSNTILIVDDVWTTGSSMNKFYQEVDREYDQAFFDYDIIGAVVFARGPVEEWVTPLFRMG